MSRNTEPVFSAGDLVTFRCGPRSSQVLMVVRTTPKFKKNYMGQQYIANFEVLVQDQYSKMYSKDMQHVFRRYVERPDSSQSTVSSTQPTHTGKLVQELLNSGSSTTKVSFFVENLSRK